MMNLKAIMAAMILLIMICSINSSEAAEERYPLRFTRSANIAENLGWMQPVGRFYQHDGDPVAIEAENSSIITLAEKSMIPLADNEASGGYCLQHVSSLENRMVISRAGNYRVWYRAFFPFSGGWNHYEKMNDGPVYTVTDSDQGPAKQWLWVKGPLYKMNKGENIHLLPAPTAWRGGSLLDKIVISPEGEPAPVGMGPVSSPLRLPVNCELDSSRFRLDDFVSWKLAGEVDERGGRIEIFQSFDRGESWRPVKLDCLQTVESGNNRVQFKIRLIRSPQNVSPRVRNLEIIGILCG